MRRAVIDLMIQKKRLILNFWGYLDHFKVPVLFMFLPAFAVYTLIRSFFISAPDGVRTPEEMLGVASPFLIISVALFYLQWRKLRFTEIPGIIPQHTYDNAIDQTVKELELSVELCESGIFIGSRRATWKNDHPNETIVIIKSESSILFNSSHNRKSLRVFLNCLDPSLNSTKTRTPDAATANETEWSAYAILKRIVLYSICLMLVLLSLSILRENKNVSSFIVAIPILILSIGYIVLDIRILLSKKR